MKYWKQANKTNFEEMIKRSEKVLKPNMVKQKKPAFKGFAVVKNANIVALQKLHPTNENV